MQKLTPAHAIPRLSGLEITALRRHEGVVGSGGFTRSKGSGRCENGTRTSLLTSASSALAIARGLTQVLSGTSHPLLFSFWYNASQTSSDLPAMQLICIEQYEHRNELPYLFLCPFRKLDVTRRAKGHRVLFDRQVGIAKSTMQATGGISKPSWHTFQRNMRGSSFWPVLVLRPCINPSMATRSPVPFGRYRMNRPAFASQNAQVVVLSCTFATS